MSILLERPAEHTSSFPEEPGDDRVETANVLELPRRVAFDRLPVTHELNVDKLEEDVAATNVKVWHPQGNFTVFELSRAETTLGDVVAWHTADPKDGYKTRRVSLQFAGADSEAMRTARPINGINPADNHAALDRMVPSLLAYFPDLEQIEIPFSERTQEDPDGLKLPGAANEISDYGLLPDDWEFRLVPHESGEARAVLKKKSSVTQGAIGHTALGMNKFIAAQPEYPSL